MALTKKEQDELDALELAELEALEAAEQANSGQPKSLAGVQMDETPKVKPATKERSRKAEAALQGFGQGASFGYMPQLSAATESGIQALLDKKDQLAEMAGFDSLMSTDAKLRREGFTLPEESYVTRRDAYARKIGELAQENPWSYGGGQLAGGLNVAMAIPGGAAAKGLPLMAKIGLGGLTGIAMGAVANPGDKEGVVNPLQMDERVSAAARDGLWGMGVPAVIGGTGQVVGPWMKKVAETQAFKQLGPNARDALKAYAKEGFIDPAKTKVEDIGRTLLDSKVYKWWKPQNSGQLAEKINPMKEAAGQELDGILSKLSQATKKFRGKSNVAPPVYDDALELVELPVSKQQAVLDKGARTTEVMTKQKPAIALETPNTAGKDRMVRSEPTVSEVVGGGKKRFTRAEPEEIIIDSSAGAKPAQTPQELRGRKSYSTDQAKMQDEIDFARGKAEQNPLPGTVDDAPEMLSGTEWVVGKNGKWQEVPVGGDKFKALPQGGKYTTERVSNTEVGLAPRSDDYGNPVLLNPAKPVPKGMNLSRSQIANQMRADLLELEHGDIPAVRAKNAQIERLIKEFEAGGEDAIDILNAEMKKRATGKQINWNRLPDADIPVKEQVQRRLYGKLRSGVEEAADVAERELDGPSAGQFRATKNRYGNLETAANIAERDEAKDIARRNLSPSDYGAGIGGALLGGLSGDENDSMSERILKVMAGGALGKGHNLARRYGLSVTAPVLDSTSNVLSKFRVPNNPWALPAALQFHEGKYGKEKRD